MPSSRRSSSASERGSRRLPALALAGAFLVLLGGAATVDGLRRRRAADDSRPRRQAATRALGYADLALSSAERWLRHPSLAEHGAARQDLPGALDVDPAGGLLGPGASSR